MRNQNVTGKKGLYAEQIDAKDGTYKQQFYRWKMILENNGVQAITGNKIYCKRTEQIGFLNMFIINSCKVNIILGVFLRTLYLVIETHNQKILITRNVM